MSQTTSVAYQFVISELTDTFGMLPEDLHPGANFAELEMDSLALAEFAAIVEERFGLTLDRLRPTATLTEAADLIDRAADAYLAAAEAADGR
ncbi:acyl carrier protein [Streptomyces sp. TRM 70351]|uniref:acyl carrier protein n=1 Tax=Streptomyces sp. TRM 70351 TaxID=3116552 RepID=UPI002E7B5423|nr:acyl carrier protein [Streptomyces sp. TRM 70351]MEE1930321.1 acyl carrier protein [Streptomyces sp. TRM 70351]